MHVIVTASLPTFEKFQLSAQSSNKAFQAIAVHEYCPFYTG